MIQGQVGLGIVVLFPWTRNCAPGCLFVSQLHKWVPATYLLRVTLQ